jgi:hypothetical protein
MSQGRQQKAALNGGNPRLTKIGAAIAAGVPKPLAPSISNQERKGPGNDHQLSNGIAANVV